MRSLKQVILPVVMLSLFTGSVFAKMQPYITLDLGMASSGLDLNKILQEQNDDPVKEDDNDMYYGVSGGLLFHISPTLLLGPELGYSSGPTLKDKGSQGGTVEVTNSQIEILGIIRYMGTNQMSLIAKFGVISPTGEIKGEAPVLDISGKTDVDGMVPKLHIAGQYNFNKNIGLSLFVSHVFGKSAKSLREFDKMTSGTGKDTKLDTPAVMAYGLGLSFYF